MMRRAVQVARLHERIDCCTTSLQQELVLALFERFQLGLKNISHLHKSHRR